MLLDSIHTKSDKNIWNLAPDYIAIILEGKISTEYVLLMSRHFNDMVGIRWKGGESVDMIITFPLNLNQSANSETEWKSQNKTLVQT